MNKSEDTQIAYLDWSAEATAAGELVAEVGRFIEASVACIAASIADPAPPVGPEDTPSL